MNLFNQSAIEPKSAFETFVKKWRLTPIIIVLLLRGLFVVLGGTGFAPFI